MNDTISKTEQEATQQTVKFFESILHASNDGIVITDAAQNIVIANESFCSLFGQTVQDVKETNIFVWLEQLGFVETKKWAELESSVNTKREYPNIEFSFPANLGSKHLSVSASLVQKNRNEESGNIISIWRDITKQKQTEQKNTRFSRVLEESLNEIYIFDSQTLKFVDVNLGAQKNIGYSLKELQEMTPLDFKPEFTAESFAELVEPLRSGIKPKIEFNTVHRRKDGTLYPVEIHLQLVTDESPVFVAIILDITRRIKTERKLQEALDVINTSPVAAFLWENTENWPVEYCSDSTKDIFGYIPEEFTSGKIKYTDVIHPDDLSRVAEEVSIYSSKIEVNDFVHEPYRIVTSDGQIKWVEDRTNIVRNENDEVTHYQGVIIDVTFRKQASEEKEKLEIRLQQAQKMEAIGTLAGGIAHDFNNILGVILGYADMAKDDAPSDSKLAKDLGKVVIAAHRAKDLVKQILAFSRQAKVDRTPIKIQPLIKEGLKMLRSSIPTTISITEEIGPKSGFILADPTQVHQILMNLCTNAYHAMEETGGALSVALETILIESDDKEMLLHLSSGEYIKFSVTDTGTGIGPDVIDKIFDPYFTTKEIGKGTGMGLAIIHGIIENYGGTITVESQLGKGTTFHVYFPVVEKDALPEAKEKEDIPRGEERILFIDDEELLAEMGKDMLERLGYRVTLRRSSFEALETFQNNPKDFDMVITDQTMPGMTGSDLARRMLQIRPDIPIILCTGYSNLIDEHSAKALGIKEFALKPLTKGVIGELIRKVLDN